ncbi:MAG: LysE family translocator, partial [Opitutales bacterium]
PPPQRSLHAAYHCTLALTLTSPATILAFVAIFAGLGLGTSAGAPRRALEMVTGVFTGSTLWWLVLSLGAGHLRSRLQAGSLHVLHVCSGLGIIALGGWQLALYLRHWLLL